MIINLIFLIDGFVHVTVCKTITCSMKCLKETSVFPVVLFLFLKYEVCCEYDSYSN